MTQSKYTKHNMTVLRGMARKRGIEARPGWKKDDFVAALDAHDSDNAPPEELGTLPPPAEAPDEAAEGAFQPPTAPPAAPAPPPPAPKPGEQPDIPPDKMPPTPKRYRLMNDVDWINDNAMPIHLKAGRIMQDNQYDIKGMKLKGAVFAEERAFEADKPKG